MLHTDYWPYVQQERVEASAVLGGHSILQKQLGDIEGEINEMKIEIATMKRIHNDNSKGEAFLEVSPERVEVYDSFRNQDKEENEIMKLRDELSRVRNVAEEEMFKRLKYEGKLNDLETKLNRIYFEGKNNELKEARKITDDEVVGLKNHIRDLKEQIEEMKITDNEKTLQVQEYRVKYLQAQQQVEELLRQIALMDNENKQVSDQIKLELHQMKIQFEEKLHELAPLPELLKTTHIQLEEATQMQKLAEENSAQISNELHRVKEKLKIAVNNLNQEKVKNKEFAEGNGIYRAELEEKQRELDRLLNELEEYKCTAVRLEEKLLQLETRYTEKIAEYTQLSKDFDEFKEESSRLLTRTKERGDVNKHYLQAQVEALERQMVTCRAQCAMFQRERDQIRQRLQIQVQCLTENFNVVETRMGTLIGQVAVLRHSCSMYMPSELEVPLDQDQACAYGNTQF